jgi:hypothetical protein
MITKKTLGLVTIFAIAVSLSGCAGNPISTPYQPDKGSFRGGYKDIQLSENMYKVSFKGNAYVSQSTAKDYTLLRSAEVCLENGFDYFSVVDSNSSVSHSLYQQAGTLNTYQPITGGPTSVTYEAWRNIIFKKPTSENTIVCYKDKNSYRNSYNARITIKSMIDSHSIKYNKTHLLKDDYQTIEESSIEITNSSYVDNPNFVPFTVKFNNPTDVDKVITIANGRIAYIIRPDKGVKIASFSGRVRAFSSQSKINVKVEAYDSASKTTGQLLDEKTSYYKSKSKSLVPTVVDDSVEFTEKFISNKLKVSFDNKLGRDGFVYFNIDTPKGKVQLVVSDGASGLNGEKYSYNGIEKELSGYFSIAGNFNQANVSVVEIKKLP